MNQKSMHGRTLRLAAALALALFGLYNAPAGRAETNTRQAGTVMTVDYDWFDISGLGMKLQLSDWAGDDDEGQVAAALPWTFPWFGDYYSTVYIDANGNVGFEDWLGDTWSGDNSLPGSGEPNSRISAFYEDLAGPEGGACGVDGGVYTYYDANLSRFIIQYDRWCSLDDGGINTFQVALYPNGKVIVQYNNVPSSPPGLGFGFSRTDSPVGVESPDGASGSVWSGEIANETAWLYQPEGASFPGLKLFLPQVGG